MGRAKQWAMEQVGQGFTSKNTRICTQCIDDYALVDFIRKSGEKGHSCSYCKTGAEEKKTVPFDNFIHRFLDGIETEWGDPNDEGVAWEQGWVGEVQDSYDLLHDELGVDFRSEKLLDDVQESLSDRQWCKKNFYELEPHQALSVGWREFTKVIKYESRYVFFRREDSRAKWRGGEEIPPSDFLDALGSVISNCRMYTELKAGTSICRLRVHKLSEKLTKAKELGAPPPEMAKYSNRMSAAGISAFYGAFDKETAIAETATSKDRGATLGHFKLLKDMHLVDFTKLPPIPSIFELSTRSKRHGIRFLREFLTDFTAPISKDGREHIDYVPTQVVAEYLRFLHRGRKGQKIDGILYNSSRKEDARACVLFIGSDEAGDVSDADKKKAVMLEFAETFELPKS
jgi:hypothetical protein